MLVGILLAGKHLTFTAGKSCHCLNAEVLLAKRNEHGNRMCVLVVHLELVGCAQHVNFKCNVKSRLCVFKSVNVDELCRSSVVGGKIYKRTFFNAEVIRAGNALGGFGNNYIRGIIDVCAACLV